MSVVNLFSGVFCFAEEVVHGVSSRLGYPVLRDEDLISQVSETSGLKAGALQAGHVSASLPSSTSSATTRSGRSAGSSWAWPSWWSREELVFLGYGSLLVPRSITHVLDVCLIAEAKGRAVRGPASWA